MAYNDVGIGRYGGWLRVTADVVDQSGNSSLVRTRIELHNINADTYINSGKPMSQWSAVHSINSSFTWARGGGSRVISDHHMWVGHDGNGNMSLTVHASIGNTGTGGIGGPASVSTTLYAPRIIPPPPPIYPPGAPVPLRVDQATATSLQYAFSGTTDGGSPVLEWQAQASLSPDFSGAITLSSLGTSTFADLTPMRTYYFRSRGRNAAGWGGWSTAISGKTLGAGGYRHDGTNLVRLSMGRRLDPSGNFVDLTIARRLTASGWIELS